MGKEKVVALQELLRVVSTHCYCLPFNGSEFSSFCLLFPVHMILFVGVLNFVAPP